METAAGRPAVKRGFGNNGTKSPVKPLVQPRKCRLRFGTGVSSNEWNTLQIARIVETLRQTGTHIADENLAHVSPLLHRHVIPNGTYHFPRALERGNST